MNTIEENKIYEELNIYFNNMYNNILNNNTVEKINEYLKIVKKNNYILNNKNHFRYLNNIFNFQKRDKVHFLCDAILSILHNEIFEFMNSDSYEYNMDNELYNLILKEDKKKVFKLMILLNGENNYIGEELEFKHLKTLNFRND